MNVQVQIIREVEEQDLIKIFPQFPPVGKHEEWLRELQDSAKTNPRPAPGQVGERLIREAVMEAQNTDPKLLELQEQLRSYVNILRETPTAAFLDTKAGSDLPSRSPRRVVLQGRGEPPIVQGKAKSRLTYAQYDVVEALLKAGDSGLSKDELAVKGRHPDANRILKRLADSDPDWGTVIQMAGKPGGRYRIKS
jgi:hypothetical protein